MLVGVVAQGWVVLGFPDDNDDRANAFATLLYLLPPCAAPLLTLERGLGFRLVAFASIFYSLILSGLGLVFLLPAAVLLVVAIFTPNRPPSPPGAPPRRLIAAYAATAFALLLALALLAYVPGESDADGGSSVPRSGGQSMYPVIPA